MAICAGFLRRLWVFRNELLQLHQCGDSHIVAGGLARQEASDRACCKASGSAYWQVAIRDEAIAQAV